MNIKKVQVTFFFLLFFGFANAQRSFVSNIINAVNIDSLILTVKQLSGDTSIILNGKIDSIRTRFCDSPDNVKAQQFIIQKFQSFGLNPIRQSLNNAGLPNGANVYAIQPATVSTQNCYVVCAHFDNLPTGSRNYGSDDNASGVAAVIEAARLLSKYKLPYNIYYVLFDYEELGLLGSDYFCSAHLQGSQPILGVINMDMIAYDGNNDSVANIYKRPVGGDDFISNKLLATDSIYQIGIKINVYTVSSKLTSDHASFWKYFMPAILFIEDDKTDFNPHYHTILDRINLFNISYYNRMAKLAIGTLADFVSDSTHVGINTLSSIENEIIIYPNPAKNGITIEKLPTGIYSISISDINGKTILSKTKINGTGNILIELDNKFQDGIYNLQIWNSDFILNKKIEIMNAE